MPPLTKMTRAAIVPVCLAITAATEICDVATYANNTMYFQGDLPDQPVSTVLSTLEQCALLCCAHGYPCASFSLGSGLAGQRACYLKARLGWTEMASDGVESGRLTAPAPKPVVVFPWFNTSLPRAARIDALIDEMTMQEQILWLNDGSPTIARLGLPGYSWESEAEHGVGMGGIATVFPSPISWGASFDVPLVARIADATAVEARAKWLAGLQDDGSSAEMGGLAFSAPNNNLAPMPTWGRIQETFGEDPTLSSAMTAAFVSSMQGSDPTYQRVAATSKHFLAYHVDSSPTEQQYRLFHSYNYSDTDIAQYYIVPFAAAVAANVSAVMCEYGGMNATIPGYRGGGPEPWGVPMCASPYLQSLLRDKLGFRGYVISDMFAVGVMGPIWHEFAASVNDATCLSMNAGTDMAMGGEYSLDLMQCVTQGNVTATRIRLALTRLLSSLMALGWFDTLAARMLNQTDPVPFNSVSFDANVSSPDHRLLARTAAEEGLVLLVNRNATLPLGEAALPRRRVALVGPAVLANGTANNDYTSYAGNYCPCTNYHGSGGYIDDPRCKIVALYEAVANVTAGMGIQLSYARGCDVISGDTSGFAAAIAAAAGADAIIAAVGMTTCESSSCVEGESNDRVTGSLDFSGVQLQLLQALHAAYPTTPLIVVLFQGGPVSSPWVIANAAALLVAWYPGYEGGAAVARALFGEISPAGRLPVTMLSDASQMPPFTNAYLSALDAPPGRTHLYYTGTPLRPFGFGLSFASFAYSNLTVSPATLAPADRSFTVTATLTHVGGFTPADEVPQLYAAATQLPSTGYARVPQQQLLAFTRLNAVEHSSPPRTVRFVVDRAALALVPPTGGAPVVTPSTNWTLWLGGGPPSNAKYGGGDVLVGWVAVA